MVEDGCRSISHYAQILQLWPTTETLGFSDGDWRTVSGADE